MTINSTTSELVQDNSNELIFGQKHNGITCALISVHMMNDCVWCAPLFLDTTGLNDELHYVLTCYVHHYNDVSKHSLQRHYMIHPRLWC